MPHHFETIQNDEDMLFDGRGVYGIECGIAYGKVYGKVHGKVCDIARGIACNKVYGRVYSVTAHYFPSQCAWMDLNMDLGLGLNVGDEILILPWSHGRFLLRSY